MKLRYRGILWQHTRELLAFETIIIAVLILLTIQVSLVAGTDRHITFKRGQTTVRMEGQFTRRTTELYYTVCAHAGNHMRVTIIPITADLNTEGNVKFPRSNLEPGNPGGVIFDEELPENGLYWIRIGQRFNEKKAGRFILEIEIHK